MIEGMTSAHFIFIPTVLLIGIVIGWILGSRAAKDAYAAELRPREERAAGRPHPNPPPATPPPGNPRRCLSGRRRADGRDWPAGLPRGSASAPSLPDTSPCAAS